MSKMSELDTDREQIERLTQTSASRNEVSRAQLNDFLARAIRLAAARPDIDHGFRVLKSEATDFGSVRLDLDNGDIVFIHVEHLVPRDAKS